MSHLKKFLVTVAVVAVTAPAFQVAAESDDSGADRRTTQGRRRTLAERIPPVSNRFFRKESRVELTPTLGMSLNDPFYKHLTGGAAVSFFMLESLGIGVSGEYYGSVSTPPVISGGAVLTEPDYNRPVYAARLELLWAPVYGKLSLLAETVLHFDTYIALGGGVVGPSDTASAFGGTVAIGQHYVMNEWMALKVEIRDQIFNLARSPEHVSEPTLQNLLTATVGLSFYFPSQVERQSL